MALEMDTFLPATPFGILTLLERYNIETKGKDCVIIGRSKIVGRPMSILMGRKDFPGNSTVTLRTLTQKTLKNILKSRHRNYRFRRSSFLKGEMIKEGAVIVDVGITRVDDDSPKGYYCR
jgi:methylenetetrahydrofolate dehydrogenase (NADP+)/methenyltetrahydrofolate cyclohydrolase